MKIPVQPPNYHAAFSDLIQNAFELWEVVQQQSPTDVKGRYLHWDKLRHLPPPEDLTSEQWWVASKLARQSLMQVVPLMDVKGTAFQYCSPNVLQKELHWLDLNAAGNMTGEPEIASPSTKSTFLIKSLIEEAISSSQLEGASTTRNVAKEMLRQGREPTDKSERMIFNNYHAMQFIRDIKDEKLTPAIIKHLQQILTESTLDEAHKAGQLRDSSDDIKVVDETGQVLHTPPACNELPQRLEALCRFANGEAGIDFIHPVIKAITLHFMLAYDHPFIDGNGRTARALFYWSMANSGYWLMEFISLSKIIKKAPVQYGRAFLYTETDDNDLTYFIAHQVEAIRQAIAELHDFLSKKSQDISEAEALLQTNPRLKGRLNFRQLALLRHALKHPRFIYNIEEHKNSHGIAYETARKDLMQMSDTLKLLTKIKSSKTFMFISPDDLERRIARQ